MNSLSSESRDVTSGIGAFYYPPITLSNGSDTIGRPPATMRRSVIVKMNIDGDTVIATDDGFIGILEKTKEEGLMILNTLFATVSLPWGHPRVHLDHN
jgi:hypothetical protein